MPAYSDKKQRVLSVFGEGLRGRKSATSTVRLLFAGKWSRKKAPNLKKHPLGCLFFSSCAMPPIGLWYPGEFSLKIIALLCFLFFSPNVQTAPSITSTHLQQCDYLPLREMRLQFNLLQHEEFPVGLDWFRRRPPQLPHCGRKGWREGTLTRRCTSRAAISPSPLTLFVSLGFQLATMQGLPLSLGVSWWIYFQGPPAEGQLDWNVQEERTAPGLFFIIRGKGSHLSSFRDCHKGSAWQTAAHHLLEKKKLCQIKHTV